MCLHGVLKTITSDKDVKFISKFSCHLWDKFSTQLQFTSAFHLQTNDQTEVVNHILGNILRYICGDE